MSPEIIYLALIYATSAMVGACLGSFASAISYRVASGDSWIKNKNKHSGKIEAARSACPLCRHQLAWFDLLPIISWVFSAGRCRYCQGKISWRYPIIETVGAIALLIFFAMGASGLLLVLFSLALPFALSAGVLMLDRIALPLYLSVALALEIIFICYVFVGGA